MNDEIFLLSREEYEDYRGKTPVIGYFWWLRSPKCNDPVIRDAHGGVAYVGSTGDVGFYNVSYPFICVRPAIRFNPLLSQKPGDRFIKYDFPWIYLGDELAIAEVPISFRRFDAEGNNYEASEIRKFLLEWERSRQNTP